MRIENNVLTAVVNGMASSKLGNKVKKFKGHCDLYSSNHPVRWSQIGDENQTVLLALSF